MEKRSDYIRIYPCYFDKELSRSKGRKVSKKMAISNCKIDDVVKVLKALHIEYFVEDGKAYPRRSWAKDGRVRVKKSAGSKGSVLKSIGGVLTGATSHV